MRWGLIGAGDIVRKRVAEALRDGRGCELVAVSRARTDLVEQFGREVGVRRCHADWHDLVRDDQVDAVYVATPVDVHAEQTVAAAGAGKHVLCEKPMAINTAQCDRMIAACAANGVMLGVAYYRRFYPAIARAKQIIGSGGIGTPVFAQMQSFETFTPTADRPRSWLLDRARAGGGPMMDFGCHRLEVLLNLFGPARRTMGLTANVVFDREVEDTAAVLIEFERGTCASLAVTHAAAERQDTLHVFGTAGSIHCENLNSGDLRLLGTEERRELLPPAPNVHRPLIEEFADAVARGRQPAVPGDVGRAVAVIEDEIYAVAS